jgi:hypothetical protein
MALSDVKKKLLQHEYRRANGWDLFRKDVELMIQNCKTFSNNKGEYLDKSNRFGEQLGSLCCKFAPSSK